MPMRYLWLSAFALCGLAAWAWIETWAQAHREAHQRLLDELNAETCPSERCECIPIVNDVTSWPDSITVSDFNGTSITHTN